VNVRSLASARFGCVSGAQVSQIEGLEGKPMLKLCDYKTCKTTSLDNQKVLNLRMEG
jgi:hypothetical protein